MSTESTAVGNAKGAILLALDPDGTLKAAQLDADGKLIVSADVTIPPVTIDPPVGGFATADRQGAKADAAATDSTSSWSIIALLKGLWALLAGVLFVKGKDAVGASPTVPPIAIAVLGADGKVASPGLDADGNFETVAVQGTAGADPWLVQPQGKDAVGADPTVNPVGMGVLDSAGKIAYPSLDAEGNLKVSGGGGGGTVAQGDATADSTKAWLTTPRGKTVTGSFNGTDRVSLGDVSGYRAARAVISNVAALVGFPEISGLGAYDSSGNPVTEPGEGTYFFDIDGLGTADIGAGGGTTFDFVVTLLVNKPDAVFPVKTIAGGGGGGTVAQGDPNADATKAWLVQGAIAFGNPATTNPVLAGVIDANGYIAYLSLAGPGGIGAPLLVAPASATPGVGATANAWDAAAVGAGDPSASVDCNGLSNISAFGTVDAATTLSLWVSQDDVSYFDTGVGIVLGGAAPFHLSIATGARYARLVSSGAATITATIAAKM